MPERTPDPQLEKSTNRWMSVGVTLTVLFALTFPVYRAYEPASRAESRATQMASLAAQGAELFAASCASCHGALGEGVDAPALNSQQFLTTVTDEQISGLIAHGIPGTEMSSYSLDFGGFLTSEQIESITVYLRSLEENAPDRPDWRFPEGATDGHDDEEPADEHDEEDAVGEEPTEHDEEDAVGEEPTEHDDAVGEEPTEHDEEDAVGEEPTEHDDAVGEEPTEHDEEDAAGFDAAALFSATCAKCHGDDLSGGDGPALGPTSHSLNEPDEHLFEAIMFGRDEMPAFIEELTEDEILGLIAYIREIQAAG